MQIKYYEHSRKLAHKKCKFIESTNWKAKAPASYYKEKSFQNLVYLRRNCCANTSPSLT